VCHTKKHIQALIKLRNEGNYLILWTCRSGDSLQKAIEWCHDLGLVFDAVNDDIPCIKDDAFGKLKSVKVLADIYLDDRNVDLYDMLGE